MQPRSVLTKTVHDHRRGALWWAVGIAFFVGVEVGIYPSVRDQAAMQDMWRDMPDAVRALFGVSEDAPVADESARASGQSASLIRKRDAEACSARREPATMQRWSAPR